MATSLARELAVKDAVENAARDLLRVRQWGETVFVHLPLYGPDGSPVTVRVTRDMAGFQVDDAGATHRELDRLGYGRSFSGVVGNVVEQHDVAVSGHMIAGFAEEGTLGRAIADVGMAAWQTFDRVYQKIADVGDDALEQGLRERLATIFGSSLDAKQTINGASTTLWIVSAILHVEGQLAIFQVVSDKGNSLYRASAVFHDLASLPEAPALVAVVKDREGLGSKLGVLSQVARVIESDQPDEVYKRAVG